MSPDWHRNNGGPPRAESVRVRFRCGDVSKHTYRPDQLNWRDRNYDFDITEWKEEN